MRKFYFKAVAAVGQYSCQHRFHVEADSEPEAIYDAKKVVQAWLNSDTNPMTVADLTVFVLTHSSRN